VKKRKKYKNDIQIRYQKLLICQHCNVKFALSHASSHVQKEQEGWNMQE
jgi:hypothetical protein